jgi:hypothetical protein
MADRLVRRHGAPLSNAVGSKPQDPGFEAGARSRVEPAGHRYPCGLRLAVNPSRQLGNRGFHPSAETAARFDAPRIVVIHSVKDLPSTSLASRTGTRRGGGALSARAYAGIHSAADAGSLSTMLKTPEV